jgi:hypothetical protein
MKVDMIFLYLQEINANIAISNIFSFPFFIIYIFIYDSIIDFSWNFSMIYIMIFCFVYALRCVWHCGY